MQLCQKGHLLGNAVRIVKATVIIIHCGKAAFQVQNPGQRQSNQQESDSDDYPPKFGKQELYIQEN